MWAKVKDVPKEVADSILERWDLTDPTIQREMVLQTFLDRTALAAAMHSVWLHGDWRWLTRNMTTEEKEAAADAVEQHSKAAHDEDETWEPLTGLRWWRE
jgi:hypothetical protein